MKSCVYCEGKDYHKIDCPYARRLDEMDANNIFEGKSMGQYLEKQIEKLEKRIEKIEAYPLPEKQKVIFTETFKIEADEEEIRVYTNRGESPSLIINKERGDSGVARMAFTNNIKYDVQIIRRKE